LVAEVVGEPQERIVGVQVSDWVKYGNFHAGWTSNDPAAQDPPHDLIEHNNTEWVTNTVQIINDTEITFETVTHYKNGTETTSFSDIDIDNGDGTGLFMFVSADLEPLDSVYNSTDFYGTWINETIALVYANALRRTNHLKATAQEYALTEMEQNLAYGIEYFWDRTTGILSERIGTFANITGSFETAYVRSEVLIDTSLWQANPDKTPPTAEAGPDKTATVDQIVSFSAEDSYDNPSGWGIAVYEWDFGDGEHGGGITTVYSYRKPGNYTVTLRVEDWGENSDTDTLVVSVQEAAPLPFNPWPFGIATFIIIVLLVAGLILWNRTRGRRRTPQRVVCELGELVHKDIEHGLD
jgi:PKD repeat protein